MSWDTYLTKINDDALQLKQLSADHFGKVATVATINLVDNEIPADRQQLQERVKLKTKTRNFRPKLRS